MQETQAAVRELKRRAAERPVLRLPNLSNVVDTRPVARHTRHSSSPAEWQRFSMTEQMITAARDAAEHEKKVAWLGEWTSNVQEGPQESTTPARRRLSRQELGEAIDRSPSFAPPQRIDSSIQTPAAMRLPYVAGHSSDMSSSPTQATTRILDDSSLQPNITLTTPSTYPRPPYTQSTSIRPPPAYRLPPSQRPLIPVRTSSRLMHGTSAGSTPPARTLPSSRGTGASHMINNPLTTSTNVPTHQNGPLDTGNRVSMPPPDFPQRAGRTPLRFGSGSTSLDLGSDSPEIQTQTQPARGDIRTIEKEQDAEERMREERTLRRGLGEGDTLAEGEHMQGQGQSAEGFDEA